MKRTAIAVVTALVAASAAQAAVEHSQDAPTLNIVASSPTGTIPTKAFDISVNENHARGQLFKLDKSKGYAIDAVTFKKSGPQTFKNASVTLYLFEGTEAQWTAGKGHTASDATVYKGTTVKPLYSETFTLNGMIPNDRFVTLRLTKPLQLDGNGEYGFFVIYHQMSGSNPPHLQMFEGDGSQRISISTDAHGCSESRKLLYYIEGTASEKQQSLGLIVASAD
jgi:hypothetical protein